jgi:outer membrane murein-binding lipoprotein Lpp
MVRARQRGVLLTVLGACLLGGCGTYVPDIQEFWGTANDAQIKVNAIASQVQCELGQAVRALVNDDKAQAKQFGIPRQVAWLETWGAQVTLTFTIDEKSSLSPGLTLNAPLENAITLFPSGNVTSSQSRSLGLGGTFSTGATRISKLNLFFVLRDFLNGGPTVRSCIPGRAKADLFIHSDLKLRDWLYATVLPQFTGIVQFPEKPPTKDVISHEVKFQIVTSGNITPTWRLVRVSANTGSPLFGASRDRTQSLLITLGQVQIVTGRPSLAPAALNSHLASEIGVSVAVGIKSLQQQ